MGLRLFSAFTLVLRSLLLTVLIAGPSLAAAAGSGIEVHTAGASWNVPSTHGLPIITIFVNEPIHNAPAGTYPKSAVPLSYRVTYGVCANNTFIARVIGRVALNGGKLTTLDSAGTNWQTVHDKKYSATYGQCDVPSHFCFAHGDYNGSVDLSAVPASVCSTTLQMVGKLGMSGPGDGFWTPSPNEAIGIGAPGFVPTYSTAVNMWLNFACTQTPQCSDGIDNDGDGAVDMNDFSCANPSDNDETNPKSACQDGVDNDGDGKIDMIDPGCSSQQDNDEFNAPVSTVDVSIVKSGPPAINRGDTVRYSVTVKNEGTAVANNVTITDPVPANTTFNQSQSDSPCALQGGNVVCPGITLAVGQSRQFMIGFTVSSSLACEGVKLQNTATVSAPGDSVSMNNQSSAGDVAVTCAGGPPAPTTGCIQVRNETFAPDGSAITPIAQFKFYLEDGRVTYNDSNGVALIENVSVGTHTVTEELPPSWTLWATTPVGGVLVVPEGPTCVTVLFKNKQVLPPFTSIARDEKEAGMSIQPFNAPYAPAVISTAPASTTTTASTPASFAPTGDFIPFVPALPGRNLNFWQSFYGRK